MNIFGFLAVLFACLAAVVIVFLLCKYGFTIHNVYEDLTKRPQISDSIVPIPEKDEKKPEKTAVISMDAVIQAANEVMGIGVVDKEIE
jgi:hypothetical protein